MTAGKCGFGGYTRPMFWVCAAKWVPEENHGTQQDCFEKGKTVQAVKNHSPHLLGRRIQFNIEYLNIPPLYKRRGGINGDQEGCRLGMRLAPAVDCFDTSPRLGQSWSGMHCTVHSSKQREPVDRLTRWQWNSFISPVWINKG
jgi:hypothetical protein